MSATARYAIENEGPNHRPRLPLTKQAPFCVMHQSTYATGTRAFTRLILTSDQARHVRKVSNEPNHRTFWVTRRRVAAL
jgi:hypothetical protein